MNIRKATIDEAGYLSELSFRSKAYWGYSEAFMEACRKDLTILPEDILSSIIFVLEDEKVIKGFIGLEIEDDSCLLSNLFIDPNEIGKGYGRRLWQHMRRIFIWRWEQDELEKSNQLFLKEESSHCWRYLSESNAII
ncbi:GNAT family N-acetyltransferase [Paenibacillus motobuensis]|uniref:GNAT family N-acetyltransferase n=1 Tax=Paenibacillus TaxID=44249 RepID=UPI00203DF98A|nr:MULTISPECIES: GNAT family N-acetyltransferase [Paenibacillus]MCM3039041.1 GNAT family N-acetyltransferase [Paenibacillus lutimineralis]MCM3646145.1 GNAT family N-acetyltransferase [Paenibacillus motobuensis]